MYEVEIISHWEDKHRPSLRDNLRGAAIGPSPMIAKRAAEDALASTINRNPSRLRGMWETYRGITVEKVRI